MACDPSELSVLQTIIYADIFQYPLTESEIMRFCIGRCSKKDILRVLHSSSFIQKKGLYYVLNGREKLPTLRRHRKKISTEKLRKAQKTARFLSFLPTIQCIGISGSLSMLNADTYDDIDFFIITTAQSLWVTRFFVTCLLIVSGNKRSPFETHAYNKICTNMWVTAKTLQIPKNSRNLFSAHEVIQMKPLVNKHGVYEHFLSENQWVHAFLPYALPKKVHTSRRKPSYIERICAIFDAPFFQFQIWYMRNKRKQETVEKERALFHPQDKTNPILSLYQLRISYVQKMLNRARQKALKSKLFIH